MTKPVCLERFHCNSISCHFKIFELSYYIAGLNVDFCKKVEFVIQSWKKVMATTFSTLLCIYKTLNMVQSLYNFTGICKI